MKKILFVQHGLRPPGGGAGVGAFMLDVLKNYGEITFLILEEFDPRLVDEYYGTNLDSHNIKPLIVNSTLLNLSHKLGLPNGLLKLHVLMRAAKKLLKSDDDFDLICTASDEQELGIPCIQYIHYPWNLYPRPDAPPHWNENRILKKVLSLYNFLCRKLSGFSSQDMYRNLTLVNSKWTGEKARERYPELRYIVVNPPALAERIDDDGTLREERFLSIGRCAPSKEWLDLLDIVARLRERGHQVSLTLAGSRDCADYEDLVRAKIEELGSWAQLKLDFSRSELQDLLVTHRYGLHGMKDEHYGMAVAELILGGCLTSVFDDGGQVEIVTNPLLRYSSVDDAVEKWDRVLSDKALGEKLLAEQLASRDHLTKERFCEEFDRIVQLCLERGVEGSLMALQESPGPQR